jgi:branched-chain amino acid transport system substrate-binding protein
MTRASMVGAALTLLCLAMASFPAAAERNYGPGVSDVEIKIGQTMPYSGPVSAGGVIGKIEHAYFEMINHQGGINGRRVNFISLDDSYSPPKTMELTRRLVEQDEVLAILGSFGTPTNAAIQRYLNERHVPQLFIQAGASRWNDPSHFPWTMPLVNLVRAEAKVYASYILRTNPNARVAVLYQNDDFGKDFVAGLNERFGTQADRMIAATASYEPADPTIDSQIVSLQASGADTFIIAAGPKFAAQAIRRSFDLGWRPVRFVAQVSASTGAVLAPAGFDKSLGVITATSFKAVDDPRWATDPEYLAWLGFMRAHYPEGDITDQLVFNGYSNAVLFADILRRCGDDLTREHLMELATHLQNVRMPSLLPGVTLNTSPTDYNPVKQLRLQRFDGHHWQLFPDIIEE